MGNQLIGKGDAPAELRQSVLAGDISFEVEFPVESGGYVQEVPLVIRSDKPMADHEIDDHWMNWLRPRENASAMLHGENPPTAQFGLKRLAFIRFTTSSRGRSYKMR